MSGLHKSLTLNCDKYHKKFFFSQTRNLHKEELTKSEAEKLLHQRVQQKAPAEQQKASQDVQRRSKMDTSSPKSSPVKVSRVDSLFMMSLFYQQK